MCRLGLQLAELLAQVAALVRELEHLPAECILLRQALGNLHLGGVSGRIGLRAGTQGARGMRGRRTLAHPQAHATVHNHITCEGVPPPRVHTE